ncbi:MAG: helix-turn-helix domain-containing protein [Desulfobacteraceae bacterium]|nr:helix-turn-helix domain-containing protein [Desulfobacteraceae bacterium]
MTIKGNLKLKDKILGDFVVPDTTWEQCDTCGHILYTPITMRAIEKTESDRKKQLLLKRPIGDFIPATEVAKILRCSRQAIHKHKRIRRGFIHFVMHNGSYQYLKESVELYNKTGDGRLPLVKPNPQNFIKILAQS